MPQTPRLRTVADPAVQASDLIVRIGLFILALAAPCAAVVSRRAIFSLTPIGVALLLIGAAVTPRRMTLREVAAQFLTPASLAIVFLTLWSAASLGWTPWPASGDSRFFRTAGTLLIIALAGCLAPPRTKTANLYLLPVGIGVAAFATLAFAIYRHADLVADGVSFDNSTLARASVGVLILAWPALAALAVRERWSPAAILACASAGAALAVGSPYAVAALAAGAGAFVLALFYPLAVGRTFAALIAAAFLLAPLAALVAGALVAHLAHPPGALAALPAWADFVKGEGLRLVTGHGLDTAGPAAAMGQIPAGAARSVLWETWYELGLVGALAAAWLAAAAFLAAAKAARPLGPLMLAALVCGLVLSFSALPAAQLWWVTLTALTALFFALAKRGRYRTQRPHVSLVSDATRPRQPAA